MVRHGDRIVYSASDLISYLECDHLVALEHDVLLGVVAEHPPKDPTVALIAKKGDEHERRYREKLEERYGEPVYEIQTKTRTLAEIEVACAETREAMKRGERIIYQGVFFDGTFIGKTDFLRRVDGVSNDAWTYEVIDTKLALSEKPYFIIQLSEYSRQLSLVQGTTPKRMYVVLGDGREVPFEVEAYSAYYRHLKAAFSARNESASTFPFPCNHCKICIWDDVCDAKRIEVDHLSQVAWMRRDTISRLEAAGVTTMAALGSTTERPYKVSDLTFERLRRQARLQTEGKLSGKPLYEILDQKPAHGFARLPMPDPGDLFFDFEGDPLYEIGEGLEYLFGIWVPNESEHYKHFWAGDRGEERHAVEQFIDFLVNRRRQYPNAHFYHYAPYETTALQRVTERHFTRKDEIDALLRAEAFVDLYPIVRQSVVISQPSYSIKKLEAYYDMHRTGDVAKGDDSIVQFEAWLVDHDPKLKDAIVHYNREDCRSTQLLHRWLLERRLEYGMNNDAEPIAFRPLRIADAPCHEAPEETCRKCRHKAAQELEAKRQTEIELALLTREQDRSALLLGGLVAYHRREIFPEYWDFYKRCGDVDRLVEFDTKAIGGLAYRSDIERTRAKGQQNYTYTYSFPEQDFELEGNVCDPLTQKPCGEIVHIDPDARLLRLKVAKIVADPAEITALIPPKPSISSRSLESAIADVGERYLAGTLRADFPATYDLLKVALPRRSGVDDGKPMQPQHVSPEATTQVVVSLDDSYAFVQGPPGTGKTYTGARVIVSLLAAGKRVGIMATSHKVVHNLLKGIESAANERGISPRDIRGVHKASEATKDSDYQSPFVKSVEKTPLALDVKYNLVSGTTYLFVDPAAVGAFDYLFIDEAGQVSLADALGASRAARNIVLLGDPLQLKQVTRAKHMHGAERSILSHILGDHKTAPETLGIFLNESHRMQPQICDFISGSVYEHRLHAAPTTITNHIESERFSGAGLRYMPVEHTGRSRESEEEAVVVVDIVMDVVRGVATVKGDAPRPMTQTDVLIVTPYNAQRKAILGALSARSLSDVRVGTVDKFQGQEAPVAIYSMVTSSPADAPRTRSFLYEKNRLNVAISRGQCLSILVCSPKLLDAHCNHVAEMELVNLLCRFTEHSSPGPKTASGH
jgi:uncharacterized protein